MTTNLSFNFPAPANVQIAAVVEQGVAITTRPSAEEVADSLVSEVSAYRDAGSFESWADEFGYDSDSRKAEKLYNQVGAQVDGVVTLFGGSDKFDHVAHNVDRL